MSEDQFTKLFKYVEEFRSEMNQRLELTASQTSLDWLTSTVDGFIKRLDEESLENL